MRAGVQHSELTQHLAQMPVPHQASSCASRSDPDTFVEMTNPVYAGGDEGGIQSSHSACV